MPQVRKILVPTDFSPYSDQAVDYAAIVAKAFKAKIVLMHVTEPFPYTTTDALILVEYGRVLDKITQSLLDNLSKSLTVKGLAVKTHSVSGVPYREIVEKAAREKADMIIMGTHGRRGVDHFLLGSVAEKVIRLAGCPVLTVRSASGVRKAKGLKRAKK